jgi:hypothetical protein
MGSSAKNFMAGSVALSLLLCGWCIVQPPAVAARDSDEEAIFEEALKEAALELDRLKKEPTQAQMKVPRQQRFAGEFAAILAKAREQHARIKRWQKGHLTDGKVHTTSVRNKRHLQFARTLAR